MNILRSMKNQLHIGKWWQPLTNINTHFWDISTVLSVSCPLAILAAKAERILCWWLANSSSVFWHLWVGAVSFQHLFRSHLFLQDRKRKEEYWQQVFRWIAASVRFRALPASSCSGYLHLHLDSRQPNRAFNIKVYIVYLDFTKISPEACIAINIFD